MAALGEVLTDPDLDPPITVLIVHNCNPATITPDQNPVLVGLARADLFTVGMEQALTATARHAGLVLAATGPGFRKGTAREQWNESGREAAAGIDLPPGAEEISMHHDAHVIDHLAEVSVPVLVLLGERDTRFAASAALFERDLDVRETVVVPDMGHMVHVKAPGECAAAVRRFMAGLHG